MATIFSNFLSRKISQLILRQHVARIKQKFSFVQHAAATCSFDGNKHNDTYRLAVQQSLCNCENIFPNHLGLK